MGIDVATYALPRLLTTRGTTVYHIIFIRNPILIKLGFTVAVKHTRTKGAIKMLGHLDEIVNLDIKFFQHQVRLSEDIIFSPTQLLDV